MKKYCFYTVAALNLVVSCKCKNMRLRQLPEEVDAMTDEEIEKAIKEDTDSAPELTEEWFKSAQWVRERKESIPVYLDHSVAEFLKHRGANYHFWLNEMLKDLMRLTTGSGNSS